MSVPAIAEAVDNPLVRPGLAAAPNGGRAIGHSAAMPPRPLAPRLRNTLGLLLEGKSEKEAAAELGISQHTVHLYVKELYRVFQVHSRAELLSTVFNRLLANAQS